MYGKVGAIKQAGERIELLLKGKESGLKASVMGRGEGGAMGGEASKARMWCVARVCCPFAMVVGMERVGVTGGASSLPYKKRVG